MNKKLRKNSCFSTMLPHLFSKKGLQSFGAFVMIGTGLYLVSSYSYLLFHTIVEFMSITICIVAFILIYTARKKADNSFLLLLGIAYVFIAFIDFIHTLTYEGMNIIIGNDANIPTQLWVAARYMESVTLLIVFSFIRKKVDETKTILIYLCVSALLLVSIFYYPIFPPAFISGEGLTPFKKISEYIISTILIVALIRLRKQQRQFGVRVYAYMAAAIWMTIVSEIMFTMYISVYGLSNFIGHVFKLISVYFVYKAIIKEGIEYPQNILFKKLQTNEAYLRVETEKYIALCEGIESDMFVLRYDMVHDEYIVLNINKKAMDSFHVEREEVIGKSFVDMFPYLSADSLMSYLDKAAKEGALILNKKISFISGSDNRLVWKEISIYILSEGNITLLMNDETYRKDMEQRLKDSLEISRALLNTPTDAIALVDKTGKILDLNKHMCEILESEYANLVGKDFELLAHSRITNKQRQRFSEVINDGKAARFEDLFGNLWYEIIIFPLNVKERCNNKFAIYARDVTAKKRLEREILEIENEVRKKISIELHDHLAQLLLGISFKTKIVQEELDKHHPHNMSESISSIRRLCDEALHCTRKMAKESFPIQLCNGDFEKSLLQLLEDGREATDISTNFYYRMEHTELTDFQSTQLYLIAQEAVINTVKHARADVVSISVFEKQGEVHMIVSDNGNGFSDREQKKGIGRKLMKYRADLIHAVFEIVSAPDDGTVVTCIVSSNSAIGGSDEEHS